MAYKLGSLFDGSGGFPLAGAMCGIEPVWAAEVEPYPIAVTRSRFPHMKHLGDISKVNGAEIEPVDVITFGSPCQDLSVAGLRKGLKHTENGDEETTRSGLFMEAVRIIKEMRSATNGVYPRIALFENVPGAFSSNKGEDFRVVCEELIKIVEPSATMPKVPTKGWAYADSYIGDGWSLAYRVFDAQYWGVPQRRRRIHLVADFGGSSAREILFERQGLRGYFAEGRAPWQDLASNAQDCSGADDREGAAAGGRGLDAVGFKSLNSSKARSDGCGYEQSPTLSAEKHDACVAYTMVVRSGCETDVNGRAAGKGALVQTERASTINTVQDQYLFQPVGALASSARNAETTDGTISPCLMARAGTGGNQLPLVAFSFDPLSSNSMKSKNPHSGCREVQVSKTLDTFDPNPSKNQGGLAIVESIEPKCYDARGKGSGETAAVTGDHNNRVTDYTSVVVEPAQTFAQQAFGYYVESDKASSLKQRDYKDATDLVCLDSRAVTYSLDEKMGQTYVYEEQIHTLSARDYKQPKTVAYIRPDAQVEYIVRRLTPTECARLQGFADWWGILEAVDSLSQKDYQFWLEVRNTHAAINGKAVKEYTPSQMVTWYNKLQTDSAEYKMWGNGIALPPALYCLQGIAEALNRTEEDDSWML